jgi:hypothetical protein
MFKKEKIPYIKINAINEVLLTGLSSVVES